MKLFCQSLGCDSTPPKSTFEKPAHDGDLSGSQTGSPKKGAADSHSPLESLSPSRRLYEPEASISSSTKSSVPENTADGIIISKQNCEIILINSSAKKMLGVSPPPEQSSEMSSQPNSKSEIRNSNFQDSPSADASSLGGLKVGLPDTAGTKIHLAEIAPSQDDEDLADVIQRAQERLDVICEAQDSPPHLSDSQAGMSQVKVEDEHIAISISSPLKGAEGETICTVIVLRDTDEALHLNRLKTEAFLKISHELRTPLTVIKGSVDNLLQGVCGKLTQKQRSYLSQTRESAEKLIQQVEKLLTVENINFRIFGR